MARIYLAGAEAIELLTTLLENDSTDVMLSFYYVQKRGALPQILKLLKRYPNTRVFMDSGALTFAKQDRGDPQLYWKTYYAFLKNYGHLLEYASEFDIDGYQWQRKRHTVTVSDEQIAVWREDLAELDTVPIVPVWRPERGVAAWEDYCKDARYPHLAISQKAEILRGEGGKLIGQAHAWQKTVHGYVAEVLTDLKWLKFDTVASTTWLVGQKFGDICIFQRGGYSRIYAKAGKKKRGAYRKYFESIGCDFKKIMADDRKEINRANIIAWNLLSKRLQLTHRAGPTKKPTHAPVASPEPAQRPSPASQGEKRVQGKPEGNNGTVHVPELMQDDPQSYQPSVALDRPPVDTLTVDKESEEPVQLQKIAKRFIPLGTPELRCALCALGPDCPKFNPEATACAYKDEFALVRTGEFSDVLEELASVFQVGVERARYARLQEQLQAGGTISKETTEQLDKLFSQGKQLAELLRGKKKSRTTAQGAGLFQKFFGGLNVEEMPVVIDGEAKHELPTEAELDDQIRQDKLVGHRR